MTRHYLAYRYIQILIKLRQVSLDGGSISGTQNTSSRYIWIEMSEQTH
jgi:hypothetical protein